MGTVDTGRLGRADPKRIARLEYETEMSDEWYDEDAKLWKRRRWMTRPDGSGYWAEVISHR